MSGIYGNLPTDTGYYFGICLQETFPDLDVEPVFQLVYRSFDAFIRRNVMQYTGHDRYPVHFVGSVAFYFQSVLRQVLEKYELTPGKLEKAPMDGLILYYNKVRK